MSKYVRRIVVALLSLVCFVACKGREGGEMSETRKLLNDVQTYMMERPDSALAVLEGMDTTLLKSAEEKAIYALLYTQAEDKNHIDRSDDSKIRTAVEYYRNSNDSYHTMLSWYYLGRIQFNAQAYSKSIISLLKAEEIAKNTDDNLYLGLIYRNCSDIYNRIYNNVECLNYAELSYEHFKLYGRDDYIRWALWSSGSARHNCKDYEGSISLMMQVIDLAAESGDGDLLIEALRVTGMSYLADKQYEMAIQYYSRISESMIERMSLEDYRNLGLAYIGIGDLKKAQVYSDIVCSMDTTQQWLPYEINKRKGNYQAALTALENEHSFQDNILDESLNQSVTDAVADYLASEKERAAEKFRYEKRILYLTIGSVILILFLVVYILYQRILFQKRKTDHNMMMVESLRETVTVKNKSINQLFKKQFDTIDKLCHTYYESHSTYDEKIRIHTEVKSIISGLRDNPQIISQLEAHVDTYKDNLMKNFRKADPAIARSEDDYLLFLYIVIGFSPRAISVLFDESLSVIYNRKARLKKRVQDSDSEYKADFLDHFA